MDCQPRRGDHGKGEREARRYGHVEDEQAAGTLSTFSARSCADAGIPEKHAGLRLLAGDHMTAIVDPAFPAAKLEFLS